MMKKIRASISWFMITLCLVSCSKQQKELENSIYQEMKQAFLVPPTAAKPKVYWWCLNGNIDTVRAREEMLAMKEAGIGGFDIFEIGIRGEDKMIPGGPAFLSDESLDIMKYVINEAEQLGLYVGLNVASSWNAGGSWIKPEHGGKSLYFSKTEVKGNSGTQSIKIPFPKVEFPKESLIGGSDKPMIPFRADGKPEYYEEVAILALPASVGKFTLDTTQVIDLSGLFNAEKDLLEWHIPPGEWNIMRYICSNSGQQLVLPSPLSAGLTVDHFDSVAVRTHLMHVINRLESVLEDFGNTALKSLYLASYEARGFVWTSTLSAEFKKINGYDISKLIPVFFDKELFPPELTKMTELDFKKTLSELMIQNLYKTSREICNEYGLKINCEAGGPGFPLYNGPAEPLKALGALDIPRGEFWVNHPRFYKDGNDSIDILRVVKEVAAASHIYQKGIVEEEAFTSFQHWQEGPYDIKPLGDRAFCEGMNRVVFHGFSHNPTGIGFPGIVYNAGTHFNDKRAWWPKVKPFVHYISRLSAVFQGTDFVADVVWYYGDKVPNSATPKNTHFKVGQGYDYEVINTEILLNDLKVEDGKLVLSNGASFSILALEYEENINPLVLVKLRELLARGAVIVGARPQSISNVRNAPFTREEGQAEINQLWADSGSRETKGKIMAAVKPLEVLDILQVPPDFTCAGGEKSSLDYIHYQKEHLDFYFISNYSNEWISRVCGFRQKDKVPEIWDPVSGEIIPVSTFDQDGKYVKMPITLAPHGSQLIVLRNEGPNSHFTGISTTDHVTPHLEYTKDGLIILQEGNFTLSANNTSTDIKNCLDIQTLDGSWELHFPKGWGAPEQMVLPRLMSWTTIENEGANYFSGTATYRKSFYFAEGEASSVGHKIYLDLGELSKVGEVWLNDQYIGITWTKPHSFDVTQIIKNGENHLSIEVANTWSNRLVGDAVTGQKYTYTNIPNTMLPTEGITASSQERVPWKDVPLIESGLLGPVTVSSYSLWHPDD